MLCSLRVVDRHLFVVLRWRCLVEVGGVVVRCRLLRRNNGQRHQAWPSGITILSCGWLLRADSRSWSETSRLIVPHETKLSVYKFLSSVFKATQSHCCCTYFACSWAYFSTETHKNKRLQRWLLRSNEGRKCAWTHWGLGVAWCIGWWERWWGRWRSRRRRHRWRWRRTSGGLPLEQLKRKTFRMQSFIITSQLDNNQREVNGLRTIKIFINRPTSDKAHDVTSI